MFVAKPSRHVKRSRMRNIFITVLDARGDWVYVWGFLMFWNKIEVMVAQHCDCFKRH